MRRSSDWDNIGLSCRLNRLNKHSRWDKWQDKVSFCSLIRFNWRVPARVPLFSLGLKAHRSGPCGHSGRLSEVVLTHYRRREVRNSIYRYWEIHIDYRSKFSYRFISFISIIYGNTNEDGGCIYHKRWCHQVNMHKDKWYRLVSARKTNSSAIAMELRHSCTNPLIWSALQWALCISLSHG